MNRDFDSAVIYALVEPETGEIRYIGVTKHDLRGRLRAHMNEAMRRRPDGNFALAPSHRRHWIRSLAERSMQPSIIELEAIKNSERKEKEVAWIAAGRAAGLRLVNSTLGAEGPMNYKPNWSARAANSASQKLRFANPAEVERQRSLTSQLWQSDEYRQKVTDGIARSWARDPKRKRKLSADSRARHADAELTARRIAAFRATRAASGRDYGARFRGESNPSAKLTWDAVREIRAMYATGDFYQKDLAAKYGVSQTLVGQIVRQKIWAEPSGANRKYLTTDESETAA